MKRTVLLLLATCASTLALAQGTTWRWVDQEGKVHYGDRPPPPKAARSVEEKKYAAPAADRQLSYEMRQAVGNFPVTLFVTADCATACKEGRDYLNQRGIPFDEKSLANNDDIAALRARLGGGDVAVPVIFVGEKNRKGFLESAWAELLDAAGYPKAAAARKP